jgi:RNA polymerase sigma-70 factor (ECF subfamily)
VSNQELSVASVAMSRHADGDEQAFRVVYDQLAPLLHSYIRRILGGSSHVDDVLQQTFLRIHMARGRFECGAAVEPWAHAIAHGVAVDFIRRESRRRASVPLTGGEPSPAVCAEAVAYARFACTVLERELTNLSAKLRDAFRLVRLEGLSHVEAGERLGVHSSVAKVRAHRAVLRLRTRWSRIGMTEPGESWTGQHT